MGDNINRAQAQEITAEILEAVSGILAKRGMQARPSRTGFGEYYTFKLEAVKVVTGRNGVNLTSKEATFWSAMCSYIGLTPDDLGAQFIVDGDTYTLLGGRNAGKFPVVALNNTTGKKVCFGETPNVIAAIKAVR